LIYGILKLQQKIERGEPSRYQEMEAGSLAAAEVGV
jgi:hypothetical protein